MKKDVLRYVQSCYSCQKNRPLYRAKGGLLKPLPVAVGPWESISMDFIQGLLMSHGFNVILIVVDRFFQDGILCSDKKDSLGHKGGNGGVRSGVQNVETTNSHFCQIGIPDLPGSFEERCSGCPEPTLREG